MRWLIVLLYAFLSFACGGASGSGADYAVSEAAPAPPMEPGVAGMPAMDMEKAEVADATARAEPPGRQTAGAPPPAPPPPPVSKPDAPPSPKPAEVAGEKTVPLLIYRATFHMAVFEATPSIDAVQKAATDLGGYLVRRDQQGIVVRVPADKYRDALAVIAKLGDVLHREETVEDVTEQFYDLQARLRNARVVRDRMEQLLKQAQNVNDALQVERELARVTTEIEVIEGKLKLLRELISFSTITVLFKARPTDQVNSSVRLPFPWLDQLGLSNLLSL
ncbi:MAG TPA: DUF4349 domain-containing protein [Polyangiaceae bacterium]|jgi:hypothetical protein|nr:DUF4349 domain-containing protein [Polyangiaceae bacterium]